MGTALLTMILPALLPAISDGMKGIFQKFFGGTTPITVDDQVKLMNAEVEKLKALALLDTPVGNISPWVANFRASFRYFAASVIILGTLGLVLLYFMMNYLDPINAPQIKNNLEPVIDLFSQMCASVFAFMFGDRMYFNLKASGTGKK